MFKNLNYELKEMNVNGSNFIKPSIGDAGSVSQAGEPYLPTVTTMYAISPGKKIDVELIVHEQEIIQDVDILPLEGWGRNLSGNQIKGEVYSQNYFYPQQIIKASDPIVMRDLVMVQIAMTPFQYNPSKKRAVSH